MKKITLKSKKYSFNGDYYIANKDSKCAFIVILGHRKEFINAVAVLLKKYNINTLGIYPYDKEKKNIKFSSFPLERIENAITFLKEKGIEKIGIVGGSTWSTIALESSSLFSDISLSLNFSPCDYVLGGIYQGKKKKMKEWPSGVSSLSYKNEELPFHQYPEEDEYWKQTNIEYITNKEPHSINFFNENEKKINKNAFIKIENGNCKYVFFASRDDTMWDSVNHMNRMKKRLKKAEFAISCEFIEYEYGSHFLFPQFIISHLKSLGGELVLKCFKTFKTNKQECKTTYLDIDKRIEQILSSWINEEDK